MIIYRGGQFVYTQSCHTNFKDKMTVKVDVFEIKNIAGTYTYSLFTKFIYIKFTYMDRMLGVEGERREKDNTE